jgi:hypothetical protein
MQISVRIRWRVGNSQMVEAATSQNAISIGDQRARRDRNSVTWAARRRAREQALRPPQQHHDHDAVDHEGAERRHIVFPHDVADAEQDGGHEGAGDARGTADGHDDQEIDQVFERKIRIEAEDLGAERAAERGQARPEREGESEHRPDVDAQPARHALVIDRRAQPAAEPRLGENELQRDGEQAADHDDHQPVASDPGAEDLELALQHARDVDELLRGAHDVIDPRHRHEDQADGEQHLIEMALGIDMDIKRALEHGAERGAEQEGERQPEEKRHAQAVHQHDRDVAARHRESAVREVDEIHQAERDRQPAGEDEQQHPVGNAVEQNGHARPSARAAARLNKAGRLRAPPDIPLCPRYSAFFPARRYPGLRLSAVGGQRRASLRRAPCAGDR